MDPNNNNSNNNPFNPNPAGSAAPMTPSENNTPQTVPAPGMDPSGNPSPASVDWNNPTASTGADLSSAPAGPVTDIGGPAVSTEPSPSAFVSQNTFDLPTPQSLAPASDLGSTLGGNPGMGNDPTITPVSSWPPQPPQDVTAAPEPVPTFVPPSENPPTAPTPDLAGGLSNPMDSGMGSPADYPSTNYPNTASADSAPTDLSHLVENSVSQDATAAALGVPPTQPENLVVPTPTEPGQVVTSESRGFPKWIFIIIGVILLVAVSGASAYFILGIGNPNKNQTTSAPAEQAPLVNPPKPLLPPDSSITTAPSSSGSGTLPVVTPQLSPSPVASPSGTSAIDLIRQRQR